MALTPDGKTQVGPPNEVVRHVAWLTDFRPFRRWVFVGGSRVTDGRGPLSPAPAMSSWAAVRVLRIDDRFRCRGR
jgi:hypothetical protein